MKKRTLSLLLCTAVAAGCSMTALAEENTPITGYLVENAAQYVQLGNFDGLEVEHPIYTVSDEEVFNEIDSARYQQAEIKSVDRPAQMDDQITIKLTATVQGEDEPYIAEEDLVTQLGYEEFGPEFDEQLIGCSAGESKSFSVTYGEDTWYEEWINNTVDFEVEIISVEEVTIPEYTEEYVTDTLGYESMEVYEMSVRDQLQADYDAQGLDEAKENALNAAMNECQFNGRPDKLYDTCKDVIEEEYRSFAENFGMTIDDLYDAYGMSEDDVANEVDNEVNRRLFISALCQRENITLTNSEYESFIEEQYLQYGYESAEEFESLFGKEYLLWYIYGQKVSDYLLDHVTLYDAPVVLNGGFDDDEVDEVIGLEEDGDYEDYEEFEEE